MSPLAYLIMTLLSQAESAEVAKTLLSLTKSTAPATETLLIEEENQQRFLGKPARTLQPRPRVYTTAARLIGHPAVLSMIPLSLGMASMLVFMQTSNPGRGGGNRRDPPPWNSEGSTSFRVWTQELILWSLLSTDMSPQQQCAAIIFQLGGEARNLARHMSYQDITNGGQVNGIQVDPVTLLLSHLASTFAPLGEESRLAAMGELMSFARRPGESIDGLLSRFLTVRFRATDGGSGVAMSWEGYAWLLLKACGPTSTQLLAILQPTQGRFPATQAEFNGMSLCLRRMGHILEGSSGNIASQLRTAPGRHFYTAPGEEASAYPAYPTYVDPLYENDPWAAAEFPQERAAPPANPSYPAYPAASAQQYPVTPGAASRVLPTGDETDTDTGTASSIGEVDYNDPALRGLSGAELDAHLFWAYQEAKSKWRSHMAKPTRKVRRFIKRGKGKGKGSSPSKGKGKSGKGRFSYLIEMPDEEYDNIFYGGKGKSKGKNRTSGKGKGRQLNPKGSDGAVMKCNTCDSEYHLYRQCPRGGAAPSSGAQFGGLVQPVCAQPGPLGDLLTYMTTTNEDNNEASAPSYSEQQEMRTEPQHRWTRIQDPTTGSWTFGDAARESVPRTRGIDTNDPPNAARVTLPPDMDHPWFNTPLAHNATTSMDMNPPWFNTPLAHNVTTSPAPPLLEGMSMVQEVHDASIPPAIMAPTEPVSTDTHLILEGFQHLNHNRVGTQDDAAPCLHGVPTAHLDQWTEAWMHASSGTANDVYLQHLDRTLPGGLPEEFRLFATNMHQQQARNAAILLQRRRRQAEPFNEELPTSDDEASTRPRIPDDPRPTCAICLEPLQTGESIATLGCDHTFHLDCVDGYTASNISEVPPVPSLCPQCRAELTVTYRGINTATTTAGNFDISTPGLESEDSGFETPGSAFPWWPSSTNATASSAAYHSTTQLADGRLSLIVDPGAWTNLMGAKLARELTKRALRHGHTPAQEKMPVPLNVSGVGNGSQQCRFQVRCPIAIPHSDGQARLHSLESPIVEGPGEDLPGLLGLRTLETLRAIMDTGNRILYIPGPGDVQIILPPGSQAIPLEKAPSGHLVMPIDNFERLRASPPGLPEHVHEFPSTATTLTATPVCSTTTPPAPPEVTISKSRAPASRM